MPFSTYWRFERGTELLSTMEFKPGIGLLMAGTDYPVVPAASQTDGVAVLAASWTHGLWP